MTPTTLRAFSIPVLLSGLLLSCASAGHGHQRGGLESLELAKHAFMESWTKHAGETWTAEGLSRVLDTSDSFVSFDAMSPEESVVRGYEKYKAIWTPGMTGFKTAQLSETENVHVWLSENMAVTASIVRIHGEMNDGTMVDVPGHLTLGWNREGNGWRIVHEHMSLGVK